MAADRGNSRRIFAPLKILGKIYLKTFRDEARTARDQIARGVLLSTLAFCFLFNCVLVLNVVCIFAFNILVQNWVWSGLITLGIQGILALILMLSARSAFKGPFFQNTKKMLTEARQELQ